MFEFGSRRVLLALARYICGSDRRRMLVALRPGVRADLCLNHKLMRAAPCRMVRVVQYLNRKMRVAPCSNHKMRVVLCSNMRELRVALCSNHMRERPLRVAPSNHQRVAPCPNHTKRSNRLMKKLYLSHKTMVGLRRETKVVLCHARMRKPRLGGVVGHRLLEKVAVPTTASLVVPFHQSTPRVVLPFSAFFEDFWAIFLPHVLSPGELQPGSRTSPPLISPELGRLSRLF